MESYVFKSKTSLNFFPGRSRKDPYRWQFNFLLIYEATMIFITNPIHRIVEFFRDPQTIHFPLKRIGKSMEEAKNCKQVLKLCFWYSKLLSVVIKNGGYGTGILWYFREGWILKNKWCRGWDSIFWTKLSTMMVVEFQRGYWDWG